MLNQFYNYLSGKIIDFFQTNSISSGAKYNIQFEREEQVRQLYEELKNNTLSREYFYRDNEGHAIYQSYMLDFGSVKLIVAATINNVQPDFLTRLRNMVGVENEYKDKGILFIHNTNLDSIIGGTQSFSKEGMPFHINSIEKSIRSVLVTSQFSNIDKVIIEQNLKRKKEDLFGNSKSIFEYRDLIEIISGDEIKTDQYKNFGLFYDSELKKYMGKKLEDRIEQNSIYYSRVDEIHNYGNPENQLERYFDDKGIEKLKHEKWKEVDFKDVWKSVEEKKKVKPLEYISCDQGWDREEGTSKAKSRIRNIIIFNTDCEEEVEIKLSFDSILYKENLKHIGDLKAATAGKRINVVLHKGNNDTNFYKITYKVNNVKFDFKIVMLDCEEKYLESIKTKYSVSIGKKNRYYILINTNEYETVFNEYAKDHYEYEIGMNDETIEIDSNKQITVKLNDRFEYDDDSELARFNLKVNSSIIPFGIMGTSEKISPIDGIKVWKLKRENKNDFKIIGDNKLQYGTKEYFTRDEFRKNIELEKQIIKKRGKYFVEYDDGLEEIQLELSEEINDAYEDILLYFNVLNKLPSLTYLNDELKEKYSKFIRVYINELDKITESSCLTREQKNLFNIGVIKRDVEDREIMLTPLHPLNIVYQLYVDSKLGEEPITDEILKKFTSTYLLPYILYNDATYIPMEQYHSPEWKYYVDEVLPRYKGSRSFVAKLVTDKIEEFIGHFKYMFNIGNNAPIRINLINTGDSKEILQGIFKYYIKQLKGGQSKRIIPIKVFIYSDRNITNVFEEVAFNDNIDDLKDTYGLDLNVDNLSEEDVLNLYRDKVHFYSKDMEEGIEYAHITFLEMSNDIKTITSVMEHIPSGIVLDGMISGVPSVFLGDSYRTGFGTKYANTDNELIKVAMYLNAINAAIGGEPYNKNQCKAISIPDNNKIVLDNIYNASHWVTFINPKVDLNFFKNNPEAKDLLIIHYSDQYTTTGGYDAITVTRKSGPYKRIIEEFLENKGIEESYKYSPNIINMFNAINGDWLLRLLSVKSHMPKEKISILSAIKLALTIFKDPNIIWVPISLEEILRVSGGAGLKQTEGFFSIKNLGFENNGNTSDDILLVGIEVNSDKLYVHYYPIEVKIGLNSNGYLDKGVEQAKSTKDIFKNILLPKNGKNITMTQRVYRNFMMQLVLTSAEKLSLYNVFNSEDWSEITRSDLRRRLLNEEYEISDSFDRLIGEAAVISFKKDNSVRVQNLKDNIMMIEMSEEDGIQLITKGFEEIKEFIAETGLDMLKDHYSCVESNKDTVEYDNSEKVKIDDTKYKSAVEKNYIVDSIESQQNLNKEIETMDFKNISGSIVESKIEYKVSRSMEILFGLNKRNNMSVRWCPNDTDKLMHTNTGIIGTMGTGKTQFTKSVVTQIHRENDYNVDGKKVGILIFDYKGDYNKSKQDFIEATDAKVFELYHLPFNPLSVIKTPNSKPMLPLHTANGIKETISKAFGLGIKQETLLRDLIMEAYEAKGIIKNLPDTWNKPAPTLKDVYDIYVGKEDLKEDSLYAAFSNLIDFEIFETDPLKTKGLFELIDGVTVIDLSGYNPDMQNLVVAITLDLFYSQMQAYGHSKIDGNLRQINKVILVDEADNFLSKNFSSLKKILKEGREFGVGTILSTQLLSHFSTSENDYANYILTWIIHRVDDLNSKDVRYIFNTQNKQEEDSLFNKIKSLNKHHSLVKMGDNSRAIQMKDKAFWELIKEE